MKKEKYFFALMVEKAPFCAINELRTHLSIQKRVYDAQQHTRFAHPTTPPGEAFAFCRYLETVKLSNRLKTIEYMAFYNCYDLKSITLPEGLETIGTAAFFKCFELESLVIPKSVKKIGQDAFGMCQKLSLVKMARTTDVSEMPFLHDTHPRIEYYE